MRTSRIAACAAAGLLGLACSSSSPTNTSLQDTWCGQGNPSGDFTFGPNGMCFYLLELPSGSVCGSQCSYQVSGSTLTLTTTSMVDGGGSTTTTCTYALTFSNGGNTLEFKSNGGQTGCPTVDVTSTRVGLNSRQNCSFGC